MISGFQSISDNGNFQVDSTFKNLAMVRKGTLTTQQYTNGATTNTRPTRAALSLADGEIVAFSCSVFCAVGARVGTTLYLYADSPAGAVIEYWIFRPGFTVGNFGLQVFNEVGDITFDSDWRLFDVRALISGHTTTYLTPGRKYAAVHSQINTNIEYVRMVSGQAPNSFYSFIRITSFSAAAINGGTITTALANIDSWGTRPEPGGGQAYRETYNNGITSLFLVIDVTGF